MKYISTKELAKKWGVDQSRILRLVNEGRIDGASHLGNSWMFPENAEKPLDGRTKTAKKEKKKEDDFFRYPIFEGRDISSFHPPLSREELTIRSAAKALHACRFEEGNKILGDLPETAENRYVRIYALRIGCMSAASLCDTNCFFERYGKLIAELQADFPHKKEMEECLHELDATLGENEYYKNRFKIAPDYPYHESFLPHLAALSAVSLSFADNDFSLDEIRAQEISCLYLEHENAPVDLQSMHVYLGCAYAFLNMPDEMTFHFKEALLIAEKQDLFYVPAMQYFYMRKPMSQALKGFSEEFRKKLTKYSDDIHNRYLAFVEKTSLNTVYRLLPHNDYFYLFSAVKGHTNKEIAKLLRVSEGTVGKRFGEIYATLGVKSKQEMVELYNSLLHDRLINS